MMLHLNQQVENFILNNGFNLVISLSWSPWFAVSISFPLKLLFPFGSQATLYNTWCNLTFWCAGIQHPAFCALDSQMFMLVSTWKWGGLPFGSSFSNSMWMEIEIPLKISKGKAVFFGSGATAWCLGFLPSWNPFRKYGSIIWTNEIAEFPLLLWSSHPFLLVENSEEINLSCCHIVCNFFNELNDLIM